MTEITYLPLNRLTVWDGNVRKTDVLAGIEELSASILAHGLLQSLVVRKGKNGKFSVVAGQRRLLALQSLGKSGSIAKDYHVPCLLADASASGTELSLAENAVRASMHPADQFEAFRTLIDQGASVSDVAARFGVSEPIVSRRLKLGRLAPVILDAYRNGDIDLDDAQAFAITDDRDAQERVYTLLPDWNRNARKIRELLTEGEIPTTDKRVKFVGIDAYRSAGGVIRQDLFDEDGRGYVVDVALLEQLVAEKLDVTFEAISAEGWSWVEIVPDAGYGSYGQFEHVNPERGLLSDEDKAENDRLREEYDALFDGDDADEDRLAEIDRRLDEIARSNESWSAETLSIAGAIISIRYDGAVDIERGLVRRSAGRKLAHGKSSEREAAQSLSSSLVHDLTSERGAAIAAGLIARPDIALVSVAHCLVLNTFYSGQSADSCLRLAATKTMSGNSSDDADNSKARIAIIREYNRLDDLLPEDAGQLWSWMLSQSSDALLSFIAMSAAMSVDAVQSRLESPKSSRLAHVDSVSEALALDMAAWFKPTASNYFARISKPEILAAIDEATGAHAPALEKLKKSELAIRAEKLVADTNWLPVPLRAASAQVPE